MGFVIWAYLGLSAAGPGSMAGGEGSQYWSRDEYSSRYSQILSVKVWLLKHL